MQQLSLETNTAPLPFGAVEISLSSNVAQVREALGKLLCALDPLQLDIEEAGTVELVMAEALNNIVEHAYPQSEMDGPIRIRCFHRHDGLHLKINDEGVMMPNGQIPIGMGTDIDVSISEMPEGGFGWFLIQDLAKDVRYHRVGKNNQLELRIAVALPVKHSS